MRFSSSSVLFLLVAGAAALACYGSSTQPIPPVDPPMGATDLPCDVAAVVARNCATCHGAAPRNGAPMALVTVAAFQAASGSGATATTIGARSVLRAKDAASPMPPYGKMSDAEIATLEAWVTGGMKAGACSAPEVGVTCTSGSAGSRREGSTMRPGDTCIHCHADEGEGPSFDAAGTVFPSLREPTPCAAPPAAPITVELTDANGKLFTMSVNSAGNFSLESSSFKPPYTARVLAGGRSRAMKAAQIDGDCNACHAEPPRGGAPGRVLAP